VSLPNRRTTVAALGRGHVTRFGVVTARVVPVRGDIVRTTGPSSTR
jgi:hypothetical protein